MKYALTNGIILNGKKDMEPLAGYSIIVEDGRIKEITKNKPTGMKIVDLKGKYVLPGLINMHVHLPGSGMPKDTKKQNKESVNKLLSFKNFNRSAKGKFSRFTWLPFLSITIWSVCDLDKFSEAR